ncbi:MAG: hypothetical protein R3E44_12310 [Paracoccaceae bacterium]
MTHIRTSLTALALGLVAAPAFAGGIVMDFPRLIYPAPDSQTTRDCAAVTAPGLPSTCAPVAK